MIEDDRSNLFRYAKRGGNTGILLVEPDRKKTLNWSKKKRLLVKTHAYSSSSLTWKRPRGNRQFSHLFIGWKGPRDDKTQNTHVLNSRASLGTSGNKMADKHPPRQVAFRSFDHAVIFRRRPQSRRKIEPNVKEENDAWKYHFKWRNSREKLDRKVKTGMMDVAIQWLRWLDWIFWGWYLPSLSINYVGMSKDIEKRLPQLYYIKMKIS